MFFVSLKTKKQERCVTRLIHPKDCLTPREGWNGLSLKRNGDILAYHCPECHTVWPAWGKYTEAFEHWETLKKRAEHYETKK